MFQKDTFSSRFLVSVEMPTRYLEVITHTLKRCGCNSRNFCYSLDLKLSGCEKFGFLQNCGGL